MRSGVIREISAYMAGNPPNRHRPAVETLAGAEVAQNLLDASGGRQYN